ncbi:MAG: hypothetical protein ACREMF_07935 [Gemmatimonadales bacterium]
MRSINTCVRVVLVLVASVATAAAQSNSGSITATALVQQPINVVGAVNLAFGDVIPGINKAVAFADAGAGRFDVTGQAGAPVNLSFTALPTNLTSGVNNLPIGSYTGGVNATNTAAGATSFAPFAGTTATLSGTSGTGNLFVFIGATVSPPTNLTAGTYTGTITLQVTY